MMDSVSIPLSLHQVAIGVNTACSEMRATLCSVIDARVRKRQGERLAAARSAAGYRSAREAALANGWPESSYRAHETGTRTIGLDDAERYARRYRARGVGISARQILFGDEPAHVWTPMGWRAAINPHERLVWARRRHFETAAEAARAAGIAPAEYEAMETGKRDFRPRLRDLVSAFHVSEAWLDEGRGSPDGAAADEGHALLDALPPADRAEMIDVIRLRWRRLERGE